MSKNRIGFLFRVLIVLAMGKKSKMIGL